MSFRSISEALGQWELAKPNRATYIWLSHSRDVAQTGGYCFLPIRYRRM
jgi:hypothetical protein